MKILLEEQPRKFKPKTDINVILSDYGCIELSPDEMLSFITEDGNKYEITRKNWGFYATPSINSRLLNKGFKTALVKNIQDRYYIMIVLKDKVKLFLEYIEKDNIKLIEWLDERK